MITKWSKDFPEIESVINVSQIEGLSNNKKRLSKVATKSKTRLSNSRPTGRMWSKKPIGAAGQGIFNQMFNHLELSQCL